MTERIGSREGYLRDEQWAIVNREDRVRILMLDFNKAVTLANRMGRSAPGTGPYRVVRVEVREYPR